MSLANIFVTYKDLHMLLIYSMWTSRDLILVTNLNYFHFFYFLIFICTASTCSFFCC